MAATPERPLGDLELAVMEVLWRHSPASVKDVGLALADRHLAYTTLMTTMDRLFKKGLLRREKQSHAFLYTPTTSRDDYDRRLVASVLSGLPTASRDALLSGFLDFASADDALLDELERRIAERKRKEA